MENKITLIKWKANDTDIQAAGVLHDETPDKLLLATTIVMNHIKQNEIEYSDLIKIPKKSIIEIKKIIL